MDSTIWRLNERRNLSNVEKLPCYTEGQAARKAGISSNHNPFTPSGPRYDGEDSRGSAYGWWLGWQAMDKELRKPPTDEVDRLFEPRP